MSFRGIVFFALVAGLAVTPVFAHSEEGVEVVMQQSSGESTVLHIGIGEFVQQTVNINGTDYLKVGLDGEGIINYHEAGIPSLPAVYRSLMIPDAAQMEVNVLHSDFYEIHNVDVAPHKGAITRNVDPATVPYTFGEVYGMDAWYPGDLAALREPYIMRDVRGVVVEVFPFQYNPVQQILRVYTDVEVEISVAGQATVNTVDRSVLASRPDRAFYGIYQSHFLNSGRAGMEPPSEDGDMLVICHGAFMPNMAPFVSWKNGVGLNTTMVDVATVGNNSTAIKTYITNLYNSSNLSYVLLVGDANEVKSGSYGSGLSDAFYSTITADKYPDLFVGRFSATTAAHVDTQVARTVAYEQAGHDLSMGGWNTWGMGVASNQGPGHYNEYDDEHIDLIRDELLAYGFTKVDQIYDPSGTKAQVTAGLNEGRRVINYCGHGSSTSWGSTGFSNTDVNNLQNVDMLPFICSVACVNGAFSGTCFAEAWLRATHNGQPTGAIGCYMSSVNQSWDPPMFAEGNHQKNDYYGAAERFWMEKNWSLGGVWYGGSCCMMDLAGSTGQQEFMNWVIFGDPSLRLTSMPALILSFTSGLPSGMHPPGPAHTIQLRVVAGKENYVPGSGYMYYRFDPGDSYTAVAFTPLGGDDFEVTIPNCLPGSQPEFYFEIQGDGGTTIMSPADAPASAYSFDVCFIELVHSDDCETNTGWTVENVNIQTGAFELADPLPTDAQPGNDHSPAGTKCWVTDGRGGSIGDYDVDGGPTRLTSPEIDLSSGDAFIKFWAWHHDSAGSKPMEVHVSAGLMWVKVMDLAATNGSWQQVSFKVSDYITPTSTVKIRCSSSDNPNNAIVESCVDDLTVERLLTEPSLWANGYNVSVATGGVVDLNLTAGAAYAGRPYLLLASLSGTTPGYPLPGGGTLPLNWDVLTDLVMVLMNSPVFSNFMGNLDGNGAGLATLNTFGPLDPALAGATAHFAYTLGNPFDFTSNPIPVTFDP